jgi:AraC-like DNA-binding protein
MGTLEGMSPIAYLRVVRLRRAHWDLRAADPSHDSVASIARRWGFAHLGRFAAAHKNMYGQTPLQALRAALFGPSARAFGVELHRWEDPRTAVIDRPQRPREPALVDTGLVDIERIGHRAG